MKIISRPDNSTSFEVIESQLENPLIDADHQDLHALKQLALPGFRHRPHHRRNYSLDDSDGEYLCIKSCVKNWNIYVCIYYLNNIDI